MHDSDASASRRRFLKTGGLLGVAALAGCTDAPSGNGGGDDVTLDDFRGSGPMVSSRPAPGGTSIADLPDLEGTLTLYLGGGEGGLYLDLIDLFKKRYPDFDVRPKLQPSSQLANTIVVEGENTPADLFLSIDAGSLGVVADAGATATLSSEVRDSVPDAYQSSNGDWVGFAGRARSIPYNTNAFAEDEMPTDIFAFAQDERFQGRMGWAPTYGAFQSMVTAMRLLNGREKAKSWLQGMLDQNTTKYGDEFLASNAVADGEIASAFANHYYVLRVQSARPDAPIGLAFTENDAGSLVNVSGAAVLQASDKQELAMNFVRHLLSAEAQEFFATRTFAYPMIPGVEPVGDLPAIDELAPPNLNLEKLSDTQPTIELMKEVGVL